MVDSYLSFSFNDSEMLSSGFSFLSFLGAGTMYLEQRNDTRIINSTLIINNEGLRYPKPLDKSNGELRNLFNGIYDDISRAGGVTWLIENQNHSLTRVDLRGKANIAVLWKSNQGDIELRGQTLTG